MGQEALGELDVMTGDELKTARKKLDLNQEQLAHRLGLRIHSIGCYERGVREMPSVIVAIVQIMLTMKKPITPDEKLKQIATILRYDKD